MKRLPADYRATEYLEGKSLDSDVLEEELSRLEMIESSLERSIDLALDMARDYPEQEWHAHSMMRQLNQVIDRKNKVRRQLQALLAFDVRSSGFFSGIGDLETQLSQGIAQVGSDMSNFSGSFPSGLSPVWVSAVNQKWNDRVEAIQSGYDAVVKKVEKGEELMPEDLVALVQFMQENPEEKIPDHIIRAFENVGPDFDEKLATMFAAAHTAIDYKLLGVKSFLEGVAIAPALKSGAWKGATWWKKMKSLNSAVQATDYVDNVSNFGKTVKAGAGFADDAANVAGKTASLGSKAWSHLGYLGAAGAVFNGFSVYSDRKNRYGEDVAMRDAAIHTGIAATSTIIGSVIGSAIPIPVVGTIAGAWIGSMVGNILATTYDEVQYDTVELTDYSDFWKLW